jgi:hypothetical protein
MRGEWLAGSIVAEERKTRRKASFCSLFEAFVA